MHFVSIIVPVKKINKYIIKDLISALKKQSFKKFELIIVTDKQKKYTNLPSFVKLFASQPKNGPADKRDLGVLKSKGNIIAFIDDDAYPSKNWLKNASKYFNKTKVAAVCGPGITPPSSSLKKQVSGWLWSSFLGAGGAGTYRNYPAKKRHVDDYPTFNLIVKKKDFLKISGFDSHFWPGEDTKLCHDLVYKLAKIIVYDPQILVYHHRRPIFIPHLKQISRFGLHRGYFVKFLPKTSKRIGYFIPLLFTLVLFGLPILMGFLTYFQLIILAKTVSKFYFFIVCLYITALTFTCFWAGIKSRKWQIGVFLAPTIFLSHLVYGIMFAKGLLSRELRQ
ncbi:glycosyltransferase [Patescibacteria group bacterium]